MLSHGLTAKPNKATCKNDQVNFDCWESTAALQKLLRNAQNNRHRALEGHLSWTKPKVPVAVCGDKIYPPVITGYMANNTGGSSKEFMWVKRSWDPHPNHNPALVGCTAGTHLLCPPFWSKQNSMEVCVKNVGVSNKVLLHIPLRSSNDNVHAMCGPSGCSPMLKPAHV